MKRFWFVIVFSILFNISFIAQVEARRGCCSWHGGVSGCASNGRIVCNDGTYSPSCGCTPQVATQNVVSSQTKDISENSKKISSNINMVFFNYYKQAALLQGDMSNIAKLKYISQFEDTEILWKTFMNRVSYCSDEACYVNWIGSTLYWDDLNRKINNIYNAFNQ